jgi:RNA polymerase sigma-70 factor (ECF subfamily)
MVAAWLFQIAHNTVVTHYRKRRPLVPLDEYDALPDERLADALEQAEDGRILRELVAALSEEQRALLALMLDGGLNSHEAGAALGKNAVTIRVQMHRIVKHLRERYQELTGERVP